MAHHLQQLLGADAELADEDFLSAVQDAENWFSVPGCSPPAAGGGPGPPGTPAHPSLQPLHPLGPPPGLRPLTRQQEQPAGPPPVGAAPQDELDNEFLMAACVELEGPELPAAPKKLRVGEAQGSASSGVQGDRQDPRPTPKLVLRPSAAGTCTPVSADPLGKLSGSCGLVPAPRSPALRPLHVSPCQPGASSSSAGLRVPQAPRQSCPPPRLPLANPPTSVEPPPRLPGGLQTPVVTNHLVQLVTAASKAPRAAPNLPAQGKTRRFPGPAGILPQQHTGRLLEEILVSAPQTPAHGAVAKPRTEGPPGSSLSAEEDFGKGPWLAMKTELGLDERDPSCFLRTYSVIMVLRKAALKQLPKNKVPSMAVMIKTLTRTNVDAGAVFRDPTGEMQGTVHRLLLEERQSELKPGSVLLLKQVGVFSPSHRNHYLNVTPNNLLKIYPPEPEGSLSQPSPAQEVLVQPGLIPDHPVQPPQGVTAPGDWGQGRMGGHSMKQPPGGFSLHPQSPGPGQEEPMGTDGCDMDDLDGLLGELPEDFFSAPAQAGCY